MVRVNPSVIADFKFLILEKCNSDLFSFKGLGCIVAWDNLEELWLYTESKKVFLLEVVILSFSL